MIDRNRLHADGRVEQAPNPDVFAALARAASGSSLLSAGELEQILVRLDHVTDLLAAIEKNTRPAQATGAR